MKSEVRGVSRSFAEINREISGVLTGSVTVDIEAAFPQVRGSREVSRSFAEIKNVFDLRFRRSGRVVEFRGPLRGPRNSRTSAPSPSSRLISAKLPSPPPEIHMMTTVQTWTDLADADPRFVVLLDAALDTVSREQHAEAVYVACKPLVGWLAGPDRGRPPKAVRDLPPPGTPLRRLFDTARPFPADGPLCDQHAYDVANRHLNDELHHRQHLVERRQATLDRLRTQAQPRNPKETP